MCLAIAKPKGVIIPRAHFENGFDDNSDGAGFAYARHGRLTIEKGFFTFAEFWSAFEPHEKSAAVIHFRQATHGRKTPDNCHPFSLCGGKFALIHNGILNIQSTEEKSDTSHFADLVFDPAVRALGIGSGALKYLVETSIGSGNKLAVLSAKGGIHLFNEKSGHWLNGAWYSNHSYESWESQWEKWDLCKALGRHNPRRKLTGFAPPYCESCGEPGARRCTECTKRDSFECNYCSECGDDLDPVSFECWRCENSMRGPL